MSRSTRDSAATRGLFARVESRSTGKLAVGAGAVEVSVHLLHGDVVAATAGDDDRQVVRMLVLSGLLDDARADKLEAAAEEGDDVFGDILELDLGEELDLVLRERFRQNLCDFVSSVSKPRFFEQKGVFVANIQMGHDTPALVEDVCRDCDRALTVDLDAIVVRGAVAPGDHPVRQAVAELVGEEPRTVSSLLHEITAEPTRAKVLIAALLDEGVLAPPGLQVEPTTDPDDLPYEDDETVSTDRNALRAMAEAIPSDVHAAADLDATPEGVEPTPQRSQDPTLAGAGVPRSFSDWLDRAKGVDDEELDFFSDHDADSRGGEKDGSFSLEDRNLEKFEVASMEEEPASEDDVPLEADEAPTARFGAPVLSEDEAFTKIQVANEILQVVVHAFDKVEGNGKGRSVMQLLVDGVPSQFSLLLHDLVVGEEGELPDEPLLRNLGMRPQTEHRQLLNNSLFDIIERALSSAADELPEEDLDEVLNSVAGYRSRLGL